MHRHNSHCTRGLDLEQRLLHYLPTRVDDDCWLWEGCTNGRGYGVLNIGKKQFRAHRAAYEVWVDEIPEGLTLDHLCKVTLCCNPAHLEPVTAVENVRRGDGPAMLFARAKTCVNGHPFDSTRRVGDKVYRDCSVCRKARGRKYDAKRRPRRRRPAEH